MVGKGVKVDTHVYALDGVLNREIVSKGSPFICYTYNSREAAEKGLSSLSFIKIANDTKEFISLEVLEFGCYETEQAGIWEVIIWGDGLTVELFEETQKKLVLAGGNKKGERKPEKKLSSEQKSKKEGGKVSYLRTDKKGYYTYKIYKAPSQSAALAFLKEHPVNQSLYYIIVETPEGNWGRDINGIYKE
ncbi:MAG: hypothetical protein JSV09_09820 [Thermoplasmata archaeon]|nr:MAG: hypothetical protein JSV09_09820 [Thermoplasmata archaeon]